MTDFSRYELERVREAIPVLEASVLHWSRIILMTEVSDDNCPLCHRYECSECPIGREDNRRNCGNTPYGPFSDYNVNSGRYKLTHRRDVFDHVSKILAIHEKTFLKGLLTDYRNKLKYLLDAEAECERLEEREEKTYCIGDEFEMTSKPTNNIKKVMLCHTGNNKISLIAIKGNNRGNIWVSPTRVKSIHQIALKELTQCLGSTGIIESEGIKGSYY